MSQVSSNKRYVVSMVIIASLSGIILGYDATIISGAIDPLTKYFDLSPAMSGWAVSNVIFGSIVGAYSAGHIADRMGRKLTLFFTALLFIVSAAGSALVTDFVWFVAFRMLGGIAVGIASAVTPMYISEISPSAIRGRMLGLQQFLMVGGQVIVYIVNFSIADGNTPEWLVSYGWRWMLASELVPCMLFLLFACFLPESPRWLVMRNRNEKAQAILKRISGEQYANTVVNKIKESLATDGQSTGGRVHLFRDAKARYILIIGCTIAVLQQVMGINILLYYAPSLLSNVTSTAHDSLFQSIFIGLSLFVGVVLCSSIIDKFGRVKLLRWGAIGCGVSLLYTSYTFMTFSGGYWPLVGLMGFILSFGLSWSLGAWLLISEIFPNRMRAVAMGFAFSSMWVSNFLVTQLFPMLNRNVWLMDTMNGAFPLLICAGFSFMAFWFIGRFLPETKGVPLEYIEPVMLSKSRQFGSNDVVQEVSESGPRPESSIVS
ncbi:sugar porter family MFS transporter [Halomonas binhaiensis]|uniref:D-xylose-proton symporter n=1 Tax=Halomonas binhaiensis TaxID=2562282 RepID=A0A5C1NDD3_9GAMM|nr:sugar porter family MFS transporter [Halomonas binhaiensis]QEM80981.1 sugar porter family MFS transporter [Halomonas binhaiensis]